MIKVDRCLIPSRHSQSPAVPAAVAGRLRRGDRPCGDCRGGARLRSTGACARSPPRSTKRCPKQPRAFCCTQADDGTIAVAGDDEGSVPRCATRLREMRGPGAGPALESQARPAKRRPPRNAGPRQACAHSGIRCACRSCAVHPAAPRHPGLSAAGLRPCVPVPDAGWQRHCCDRRLLTTIRPPNPISPSTALSTACRRALARTDASRKLNQPATPPRCRRRTRHGSRRVARPRRGICAVSQLPHPARRGPGCQLHEPIRRPDAAGCSDGRQADLGELDHRHQGGNLSDAIQIHIPRTSRPSRPPATPAISATNTTTIRRRWAA